MSVSALEAMVRSFASSHPDAAARSFEGLEPRAAAQLLQQLPTRIAAPVAERLSPDSAAVILSLIGPEGSRELLGSLPSRQAAAILHHLEDAVREATLSGLQPDRSKAIRDLLRYSPETAGGMMDMRLTSLPIDLSVREAIAALRRARRDTLYYLYVTDRVGKLIGVLDMRELLLASPRDPLERLVKREIVTVPVDMPRDEVGMLIQRRRFVALPVVDRDGHLLGVVKPDEVLEAFQQEAFGDLQKMVGAGEDERALSPVSVVVRKRLPWLYVNLATAFLASTVVGLFETTIQQVTALAVLLPVVAGQGGNTGAQSLAVVMRGLALRELVPGMTPRLLRKEVFGALINGLFVALGTGLAVLLWDGRLGLVLVIMLAMVVNMTAAGLFGAAIPLILRALGRDPAQSASIFLTTVTDVVGFAAFLGFAVLFLPLIQ
ncbi:MAG TPA: magnesium transporter, partial [Planctomycetota bacterium]|nr:magnesium transporter [Planctomycetota bacterium]